MTRGFYVVNLSRMTENNLDNKVNAEKALAFVGEVLGYIHDKWIVDDEEWDHLYDDTSESRKKFPWMLRHMPVKGTISEQHRELVQSILAEPQVEKSLLANIKNVESVYAEMSSELETYKGDDGDIRAMHTVNLLYATLLLKAVKVAETYRFCFRLRTNAGKNAIKAEVARKKVEDALREVREEMSILWGSNPDQEWIEKEGYKDLIKLASDKVGVAQYSLSRYTARDEGQLDHVFKTVFTENVEDFIEAATALYETFNLSFFHRDSPDMAKIIETWEKYFPTGAN